MENRSFMGCLAAILSGICYGAIPLFILYFSRDSGIGSPVFNMMRMFFAAIIFLPAASAHFKEIMQPVSFIRKILLCSFLMTSTTILLYAAYEFIPSGIGVMLHFLHPLMVLIIEVLFFNGKVDRAMPVVITATLTGIVLLCDTSALSGRYGRGILLALLSAVTFAFYLSAIEHQKISSYHISLYTCFLCLFNTGVMCVYNILKGCFRLSFSIPAYCLFLLLGLIASLAVSLQALAIRSVGPVTTSILGTLEPIVCIVGSALILGDRITARMAVGSILILFSVIKVSLLPPGSR